jgi:RNA polymerase sigma-70 factor (ECF subfamily)
VDTGFIQSVNAGDKKAFGEIFDQYFNALCAFSYRYIPDRSEVEDIIQEVFIAFWKHNKDFNTINAVKAFLYTSARNKCLNHLKHQNVVKKHQSALIYELESEQFFKNHVVEEEAFNQLYSEIRKLPVSAQNIMILALKGLKNNEIATELNISVNTVKTQKKISYAKLKVNLDPVLRAILLSL